MMFFDKGLLAMGNVRGERGRGGGGGGRKRHPVALHPQNRCHPRRCPAAVHSTFPPFSPPSQILFLSGVALTIGPSATLRFFTRRKNLRGSAMFSAGLFLVVVGWAVVGMAIEAYGFWLLFAGFFPTALAFLRRVPGLGALLDLPVVKHVLNRVAPAQLPV